MLSSGIKFEQRTATVKLNETFGEETHCSGEIVLHIIAPLLLPLLIAGQLSILYLRGSRLEAPSSAEIYRTAGSAPAKDERLSMEKPPCVSQHQEAVRDKHLEYRQSNGHLLPQWGDL